MKNYTTPEFAAKIEAHAKSLSDEDEDWIPPFDDVDEQPEPPDRGAPPPGDSSRLQFHPAADKFPLMSKTELTALADDIEAHGQDEDCETLDDMVLGGRNVYDACLMIGREPRTRALSHDTNPVDYPIRKNLMRRHSTKLERAMFAARLVKTGGAGGDRKPHQRFDNQSEKSKVGSRAFDFVTPADAGRRIGLSEDAVKVARYIIEHGAAEFVAAIDAGIPWLTLNYADKIAHSSKDDQELWLFNHKHAIKPVKRARRPPRRVTEITATTLKALSSDEAGAVVTKLIPRLSEDDALRAVKQALPLANRALKLEGKRLALVDDSNLGPSRGHPKEGEVDSFLIGAKFEKGERLS
jgi:hypothetical protein